jgi:2',3'-cyclic-nucleotide 2'-phosphodiesterase/3'-nucleotidase/5'-nucleotidase
MLVLGLTGAAFAPAFAQRADTLIVASTTDVHGRLRAWDYYSLAADTQRGLALAGTVIDSLRAVHPDRVVLLDAGDLLQGNPLTYVAARVDTAGPHPVIAAMNVLRYDAAALGNHEFNYGLPALRRALQSASFPFLAANLRLIGREARRPIVRPYRIVRRGGWRVGIVGGTTPGSMVWDRTHLQGRVTIGDVVAGVRHGVAAVRAQGADLVIVVLHTGLDGPSSYDTVATGLPSENVAARVAHEVPGVDLIVYGHSHRELADTTINGVLLQQPRNYAASVAVATLAMDARRNAAGSRVRSKQGQLVRVAGRREHAGVVAAVERTHRAATAWVGETLGTTPVAWRADSARVMDTPLIDFVLEVQRRVTGAQLSSTTAFDLNASLDAGPITVAELARLYPYDNTLRAVRVTGRQLRAYLEHSARYYRTLGSPEARTSLVDPSVPGFNFEILSGAEYTLDLSKPLGQRVTRLEVAGRRVEDADTFTMALNNYRQSGGGGYTMLDGAPVVFDNQVEIRDLLIAEVRERGTLSPEAYHSVNWRLEPAGVVDSAYRAMRALPFDRSSARPVAASAHLQQGRWLRVIGTNDFHGGLSASDFNAEGVMRGGAAGLATAIREAREECPKPRCVSIWVDGGDQWQGTAASTLTVGRPVTALFNRLGLNAAALGNHEFDWGVDTLRARLRDNRFPVLAANLVDSTGAPLPWMPGDTLLTIDGLKVGVIGLMTRETATAVRRSVIRPYRLAPPAPIVDQRARALRARGAEVVVVTSHIGAGCARNDLSQCTGEAVDLARALTEKVDAIVAGHAHRGTAAVVNGIPITQAYQKGSAIGIIDIPLDGGTPPAPSVRNVRSDSVVADAAIAAWVDSVVAPVNARLRDVVAHLAEPMRRGTSGTLGNLIADAQRSVGRGDVAIMNSGGVRADLKAGPVTVGDLFEVQPFGNRLVRLQVTGATILRQIEAAAHDFRLHLSGLRVEVDSMRPVGQRVQSARFLDGRTLEPGRTYTLVLNDFLAEGGDGISLDANANLEWLGADREALEEWLRAQSQPVRAPTDTRVILRP